MDLQNLTSAQDTHFLKALVKQYPEAELLAGEAENSPEGNQYLKESAIAYQVFDETIDVHETAIEADRTFLGLKLFKAAYNKDQSKFPHLSDINWQKLVELTHDIVASPQDLEIMLYALVAQDIGKTKALSEHYKDVFGFEAEDHDKLLFEFTRDKPDCFAGFLTLSPDNQKAYLAGLESDMNLGQFVQGESLPCNIEKMLCVTEDRAKRIRLLTELYDFAGVTGHIVHDISLLLNDENYHAYNTVIQIMLDSRQKPVEAYSSYMRERLKSVELSADHPTWLPLARIVALSRSFSKEQGKIIKRVFDGLDKTQRDILIKEMSVMGIIEDEPPAILIYYAPALISNMIRKYQDFETGLKKALLLLAKIYQFARTHVGDNGMAYVSVSVNKLAKQMNQMDDERHRDLIIQKNHYNYVIYLK